MIKRFTEFNLNEQAFTSEQTDFVQRTVDSMSIENQLSTLRELVAMLLKKHPDIPEPRISISSYEVNGVKKKFARASFTNHSLKGGDGSYTFNFQFLSPAECESVRKAILSTINNITMNFRGSPEHNEEHVQPRMEVESRPNNISLDYLLLIMISKGFNVEEIETLKSMRGLLLGKDLDLA